MLTVTTTLNYYCFLIFKTKLFTCRIYVNLHRIYLKFKHFRWPGWKFNWCKKCSVDVYLIFIVLFNWNMYRIQVPLSILQLPFRPFNLSSRMSVLGIYCGNGEKGFKMSGCLFSKCSWDVQEESGNINDNFWSHSAASSVTTEIPS